MTELERLADQLHRALTGDPWYGPAIREILRGVAAKQASARPVAGAHSIWELVHHITSWLKMIDSAVHGKPLLPWPSPAMEKFDWPRVTKTDAAGWVRAQRDLYDVGEKLRRSIRAFDPKRMRDKVPGRTSNFADALPGIVQHTVYHAGQIAILKNALKK
ncbi:MAG: DinB family protein [Acidobacteriota bacterium]|nr:DinB family protein [Acidobacteriota bacterium]